MKKIIMTIDPKTGRFTIATEGYKGASCIEATKELERRLGVVEPERELTHEYHEQVIDQQQTIGGES